MHPVLNTLLVLALVYAGVGLAIGLLIWVISGGYHDGLQIAKLARFVYGWPVELWKIMGP